jgi:hypothetical protein
MGRGVYRILCGVLLELRCFPCRKRGGNVISLIIHERVPLLGTSSARATSSAPHCFCEAVAHCLKNLDFVNNPGKR